MISPWKRANIQRSFDSDPNYTRCAKDCHVDPKTVHKYTDKDVVPKSTTQRVYRTRTAPLDEYWPEIKVLLENDPKLKPYAILEFLLDKYPRGPYRIVVPRPQALGDAAFDWVKASFV